MIKNSAGNGEDIAKAHQSSREISVESGRGDFIEKRSKVKGLAKAEKERANSQQWLSATGQKN